MKILLDTHAFIWFCEDSSFLPENTKAILENKDNLIYLSIASLWEMAIKMSLKKLELTISFHDLPMILEKNGFHLLPISYKHLQELKDMPFHHRDPFDRLLIAQAKVENMTLISNEKLFDQYTVIRIF